MTVRIEYEINTDSQYLIMFYEGDYGRERHYVSGPETIIVKRGEPAPACVKHAITTVALVELLDELLKMGLRPTSNAWSAGHVSDLKKHIDFAERMATALLPKPENKNG